MTSAPTETMFSERLFPEAVDEVTIDVARASKTQRASGQQSNKSNEIISWTKWNSAYQNQFAFEELQMYGECWTRERSVPGVFKGFPAYQMCCLLARRSASRTPISVEKGMPKATAYSTREIYCVY